jgi:plasmid maintenance system killer protein
VITSFADHRTKELFDRQRVKGLSEEIQRAALRKFLILDLQKQLSSERSRRDIWLRFMTLTAGRHDRDHCKN